LNHKNTQFIVNIAQRKIHHDDSLMTAEKHNHTHKKRYLAVISHSTRFKEFNSEKKTATKTSDKI
jgi:hypothetical protein